MPRVRRLVDGNAPALHTGGSSYHNRFHLSNFENLPSFKNPTVTLSPSLLKTSVSLLSFSLTNVFSAIFDLKSLSSSLRLLLHFRIGDGARSFLEIFPFASSVLLGFSGEFPWILLCVLHFLIE